MPFRFASTRTSSGEIVRSDRWNATIDSIEYQPVSYTIYRAGSTTKAKNGTSGDVDYTSTTDTALVIRNAIAAIKASSLAGGKIEIKANSYTDLNSLTLIPNTSRYAAILLPSNISLVGENRGTTTLKLGNSVGGSVIAYEDRSVGSLSNTAICDLTIDGNKANNTNTGVDGDNCGIRGYATYNHKICDVEVKNCAQQGVYVTNSQEGLYYYIYSHHNGKEGVVWDSETISDGVSVICWNNAYAGFYVVGGSTPQASWNSIYGGSAYNNSTVAGGAVGGLSISNAIGLSVHGFRAWHNGSSSQRWDGIFVTNSSTDIFLTDCAAFDNERAGCLINNSSRVHVKGGYYYNNREGGVDTAGNGVHLLDSTYCEVSGITAYDNRTPKNQRYGIAETGTSDFNKFRLNDLRNNSVGRVLIAGANSTESDGW